MSLLPPPPPPPPPSSSSSFSFFLLLFLTSTCSSSAHLDAPDQLLDDEKSENATQDAQARNQVAAVVVIVSMLMPIMVVVVVVVVTAVIMPMLMMMVVVITVKVHLGVWNQVQDGIAKQPTAGKRKQNLNGGKCKSTSQFAFPCWKEREREGGSKYECELLYVWKQEKSALSGLCEGLHTLRREDVAGDDMSTGTQKSSAAGTALMSSVDPSAWNHTSQPTGVRSLPASSPWWWSWWWSW